MFAPALPGFPTSRGVPQPRMRLSLKESRRALLNATAVDRKSGIRGPKMLGEAHHTLSFQWWRRQSKAEVSLLFLTTSNKYTTLNHHIRMLEHLDPRQWIGGQGNQISEMTGSEGTYI
jgi:hypothetical protein